jgi:hypothetical protein
MLSKPVAKKAPVLQPVPEPGAPQAVPQVPVLA